MTKFLLPAILCLLAISAYAESSSETHLSHDGDKIILTAPSGMVLTSPINHTSPITKIDEHKTICAGGYLFEIESVGEKWNTATIAPVKSWFG